MIWDTPTLASGRMSFDWIVKEATITGERVRTYWYVIKTLDFFPYHFPEPTKNSELERLLYKHKPFEDELSKLDDAQRPIRMVEIVKELRAHQEVMQNRFNGWIAIQEGISVRSKSIEFRRAGAMSCNLFDRSLGKEKAVDVKLATDMIMLRDIYDVAVIVSGDQDYVPAVEEIKDCGKSVISVAFLTRGGQLLPGGARRLNQVTDWRCNIPYNNLADHLKINQASF
jgi:uncharacterized LabA/DUF88 family protein